MRVAEAIADGSELLQNRVQPELSEPEHEACHLFQDVLHGADLFKLLVLGNLTDPKADHVWDWRSAGLRPKEASSWSERRGRLDRSGLLLGRGCGTNRARKV